MQCLVVGLFFMWSIGWVLTLLMANYLTVDWQSLFDWLQRPGKTEADRNPETVQVRSEAWRSHEQQACTIYRGCVTAPGPVFVVGLNMMSPKLHIAPLHIVTLLFDPRGMMVTSRFKLQTLMYSEVVHIFAWIVFFPFLTQSSRWQLFPLQSTI